MYEGLERLIIHPWLVATLKAYLLPQRLERCHMKLKLHLETFHQLTGRMETRENMETFKVILKCRSVWSFIINSPYHLIVISVAKKAYLQPQLVGNRPYHVCAPLLVQRVPGKQ